MMIDTTGPAAPSAPAENGNAQQNGEANEENYEQEALNYFSLALQIIGDFSSGDSCLEA